MEPVAAAAATVDPATTAEATDDKDVDTAAAKGWSVPEGEASSGGGGVPTPDGARGQAAWASAAASAV